MTIDKELKNVIKLIIAFQILLSVSLALNQTVKRLIIICRLYKLGG
jgi:hypothetical protein